MICEEGNFICKSNNPFTNRKILCIVEDTPENLGMINTVRHMVEVEQLGEQKNAK